MCFVSGLSLAKLAAHHLELPIGGSIWSASWRQRHESGDRAPMPCEHDRVTALDPPDPCRKAGLGVGKAGGLFTIGAHTLIMTEQVI